MTAGGKHPFNWTKSVYLCLDSENTSLSFILRCFFNFKWFFRKKFYKVHSCSQLFKQ